MANDRLIELNNKYVDMVNAGRGLVPYVKHYDYCAYGGHRVLNRADAVEQLKRCNCGLAEFIVRAFGVPVGP